MAGKLQTVAAEGAGPKTSVSWVRGVEGCRRCWPHTSLPSLNPDTAGCPLLEAHLQSLLLHSCRDWGFVLQSRFAHLAMKNMSGGGEGGLLGILKLGFSGKMGLVSELKCAGQG